MTRPVVHLADHIKDQIIKHCLDAMPLEGCGLIAMSGNEITAAYPTENADQSPISYTIPPEQHYKALVDAESNGWVLGGVFHSHPRGSLEMSNIDKDRALEPDWVYLVCNPGSGEMAAWSAEGRQLEIRGSQTRPGSNH